MVAHLEKEVGCPLIDRRRRPLRPTPEGKIFYQGCKELLHGYRTVLGRIRRRCKKLGGRVRIVSVYSIGLHTLSALLGEFRERFPDAEVRLEYCHPEKVYGAVLEDEADLGVISYPRHDRGLEVVDWIKEEMVLACPPGHPLAEHESLALEALAGASFISFDPGLTIRREIDRRLRQLHVRIDILGEFDNIETIKKALIVSNAVSILPRPSIESELARGALAAVSLSGADLRRPVGFIHRKGRALTPAAAEFVASMLDARERLGGG